MLLQRKKSSGWVGDEDNYYVVYLCRYSAGRSIGVRGDGIGTTFFAVVPHLGETAAVPIFAFVRRRFLFSHGCVKQIHGMTWYSLHDSASVQAW